MQNHNLLTTDFLILYILFSRISVCVRYIHTNSQYEIYVLPYGIVLMWLLAQHALTISGMGLHLLWHSLKRLSDGVLFKGLEYLVFLGLFNFIFSHKLGLFYLYFCVLSFCVLPPLCFTFLSKDEDFYLQHTLLVLSSFLLGGTAVWLKERKSKPFLPIDFPSSCCTGNR